MAASRPLRIALLSRSKKLYSIRRLKEEAKALKLLCDTVDPVQCQMVVSGAQSRILLHGRALPTYDAVLPRIGTSLTEYGLSVVKQFEMKGIYTVNSAQAISDSRNKMRCLQILTQAGLQVPATVLTRTTQGLRSAVEAVKGLPVVLKILRGTQGMGVMLVNTPISLGSVLDTLRTLEEDVIIQQFIVEGGGQDYRIFVVGDEVVAAMRRTAPKGEFRSNIHRGGSGDIIRLPKDFKKVAIRATKVLGLQVAGVDLMESKDGPLIIELNSSPGFEGIEKATGINVGRKIIQHIKDRCLY